MLPNCRLWYKAGVITGAEEWHRHTRTAQRTERRRLTDIESKLVVGHGERGGRRGNRAVRD